MQAARSRNNREPRKVKQKARSKHGAQRKRFNFAMPVGHAWKINSTKTHFAVACAGFRSATSWSAEGSKRPLASVARSFSMAVQRHWHSRHAYKPHHIREHPARAQNSAADLLKGRRDKQATPILWPTSMTWKNEVPSFWRSRQHHEAHACMCHPRLHRNGNLAGHQVYCTPSSGSHLSFARAWTPCSIALSKKGVMAHAQAL